MSSTQTYKTFDEMPLPAALAKNLERMGFVQPTPVQRDTIPLAMEGKDVLGTGQTGTGKTAAFGIPVLNALYTRGRIDALILVPTRELAAQVQSVFKELSEGMKLYGTILVGGESFPRQVQDLRRGADYIIATPGRLIDHLERKTVRLDRIGVLVLDEVDRMLDMGFLPQVKTILKRVPVERQTLLFSATLPTELTRLAQSFMKDPVRIAIEPTPELRPQITEQVVRTTAEGKNAYLLNELPKLEGRILIFTRTKIRADRLVKMLKVEGHRVVSLHGDRSQVQRKIALEKFRTGSDRIMVATDLAGRGIDIEDIQHVINYDVPATREDYIHRIGRTGRYGKSGVALTLLINGDMEGERIVTGEKAPARTVFRSRRRFR